jgi:hypothetical protein
MNRQQTTDGMTVSQVAQWVREEVRFQGVRQFTTCLAGGLRIGGHPCVFLSREEWRGLTRDELRYLVARRCFARGLTRKGA